MRTPHHHHDGRRSPRRGDFDDLGLGPGFGPGFGPGGGRGRGRRRGGRGGDVRAAALLLLADGPRHGYQLIQDVSDRTEGAWTPSPGSIYPVLQQLEDEGLVEFERVEGRKTASLTADGQAYVAEHRERLDAAWREATTHARGSHVSAESGQALKAMVVAWSQVAKTGTEEQQARATALLEETRRRLYGILAGDEPRP